MDSGQKKEGLTQSDAVRLARAAGWQFAASEGRAETRRDGGRPVTVTKEPRRAARFRGDPPDGRCLWGAPHSRARLERNSWGESWSLRLCLCRSRVRARARGNSTQTSSSSSSPRRGLRPRRRLGGRRPQSRERRSPAQAVFLAPLLGALSGSTPAIAAANKASPAPAARTPKHCCLMSGSLSDLGRRGSRQTKRN